MKNNKTRQLAFLSLFIAIEVVLTLTPLGFIFIGPIKATTLHIPVIIASLLLGYKEGMIVGFFFGLMSFLNATFNPTPLSFLFTPFITIGNNGGNFASLLVTFVPRILLGFIPYFIYKILKNHSKNSFAIALSSLISTLIHTALVLGLIYIFFAKEYSIAIESSTQTLAKILVGVVFTNGIVEAIICSLIATSVVLALEKTIRR